MSCGHHLDERFTVILYLWFMSTLDVISFYLNTLRLVLWPNVWSVIEKAPCRGGAL